MVFIALSVGLPRRLPRQPWPCCAPAADAAGRVTPSCACVSQTQADAGAVLCRLSPTYARPPASQPRTQAPKSWGVVMPPRDWCFHIFLSFYNGRP